MSDLQVSPRGRRYGLHNFSPDKRDLLMKAGHVRLPNSVTLAEWLGPVKDQGALGACTGFAFAGMREFLFRKYHAYETAVTMANAGLPVPFPASVPGTFPVFSPMHIYWHERQVEGTSGDVGAQLRSGCKVLNKYGVCLEATDPYMPAQFERLPTETQESEAARFKAGAYHRIIGLQDMKSCLASGYVFTMGIQVYESFESTLVAVTGNVPVPNVNHEACYGGHAVLCFGYDDTAGVLLVRNSWGQDWGAGGNFRLPYKALEVMLPANDCWIQHLGPAWK